MSKFYDPTPVFDKTYHSATGKALADGSAGAKVNVLFAGKTVEATVVGNSISSGDEVLVVTQGYNYPFVLKKSEPYFSSCYKKLSEWAIKGPANLAIRKIMDSNEKNYLYHVVEITSYDSTKKTALVRAPFNKELPVKLGNVEASVTPGMGLVFSADPNNIHVIGSVAAVVIPIRMVVYYLPYGSSTNTYANIAGITNHWTLVDHGSPGIDPSDGRTPIPFTRAQGTVLAIGSELLPPGTYEFRIDGVSGGARSFSGSTVLEEASSSVEIYVSIDTTYPQTTNDYIRYMP